MKIGTESLMIGALILIGLSNGENVRSSLQKGGDIKQAQSEFSDRIRRNKTEARNAQKLSQIALERYQNNCILVVDSSSGKESYFQPGSTVLDTQLGRTLRSGASICNRLGDTAIVSEAGTIVDVARITIAHQAEFKQLLSQRQ